MSHKLIKSIAIVGNGVVAWAAAAAFAARLRGVAVTVVEKASVPPSLADLVGISTPSITDFHYDIRLDERQLMKAAAGCFRLGGRFSGWNAGLNPYFHCHGEHGETISGAAFHHHFSRLGASADDFADYSIASVMARSGRFVHPSADPNALLARFNYGLHVDPGAYATCLRSYAESLGVASRSGVDGVTLDSVNGCVNAVPLADGSSIKADLYVDTVGALADAISTDRTDWSFWLPASYLENRYTARLANLPLFEDVEAMSDGWLMRAVLREANVETRVSASQNGRGVNGAAAVSRTFSQGRRRDAWLKNVVSIGDAAVTLEPMEGLSLHIAFAHIDRIIASLPDRDFHPVELTDFNRQTADEADRLRDFVLLHYVLADRPEELWRDIKNTTLPSTLSDDLRLYGERGHLPVHDGESFPVDSWLSVLTGQGMAPRRIDPMAAEVPRQTVENRLRVMRENIVNIVSTLPSHGEYIQNYIETV